MRGIVAALLLTSAGGFATRRTLLRLSVQSRGVPDSAAPPAPSLRSDVASFKVMDVVESAQALEAEGHRVYHLEVGQPSTGAPAAVKRAAARALDTEKLGYTQSKGIPELREAIIKHYYEVGGIPEGSLDPERLVITTGSSGGFLLAFAACFDKDDHVAVGRCVFNSSTFEASSISMRRPLDPYPCNPPPPARATHATATFSSPWIATPRSYS
uniref:Aminotransferase class I/classII large domain-containing protein n=1 Tax=Phaeomonas parva TaxID=124430 RepID=A0A7S1U478_9STRA|mmetsp:Transcript_28032/g.89481  ORF Transcript_28032/g.89481 Transcript_28032/m.89481 type:complete len:213 (+) Transcript_28032:186-824(+)